MKKLIFLFWTFLTLIVFVNAQDCGTEYWNIKILTDKQAKDINYTPVSSSVNVLTNLPKPNKLPNDRERLKEEFSTVELTAYLVGYKVEADKDFHVVIKDIKTKRTMIVELPDPECKEVQNSYKFEAIKKCRDWFKEHFNPVKKYKKVKKKIKLKLSGVVFWDRIHGQIGRAKNGIEIHPVLSVEQVLK